MDQGRAAVYGALVGVVGTLLGSCFTWLQLRTQAKANNAMWRRQIQRDSYGVLIERIDALRKAFEPIERRAQASASTGTDLDQLETAKETLFAEFDAATIVVMLEGPTPIAELAIQVGHGLRAWGAALEDLAKAVTNGESDLDSKRALTRSVGQEAGELVGTFLLAARHHLDRA
ncbi:hypothetical protein [Streptomyces sp. Y7]|uniref:hypothetical protein n=1 Tax=Streptomyces sp. Y7 TaxID=3342392 RepID=UPI00370F920D